MCLKWKESFKLSNFASSEELLQMTIPPKPPEHIHQVESNIQLLEPMGFAFPKVGKVTKLHCCG